MLNDTGSPRETLRFLIASSIVFFLALAGCGPRPTETAGGTGSEETNGALTGRIFFADGAPAPGVYLHALPDTFLVDTSLAAQLDPAKEAGRYGHTDADGRFRIDSLVPGEYRVEARQGESGSLLLTGSVAKGTVRDLGSDTLRPPGSLRGSLELPPGGPSTASVRIYGLDRLVRADSGGHYVFNNLPPGTYRLIATSGQMGRLYLSPAPVVVRSADTAVLDPLPLAEFALEDYSAWPHSRVLSIDAGALGLGQDLADAQVLVRLDAANFDFSESRGSDIRFASPSGAHLHYQVERWDGNARLAEIWVKLDSLPAALQGPALRMYWGNPKVTDLSDGESVFGGYGGVWHMADAEGAAPGAIGLGAAPDSGHFFSAVARPAYMPSRSLTLTAWFKADSAMALGSEIATMGNNYGLRLTRNGELLFYLLSDSLARVGATGPGSWETLETSGEKLCDGRWHWGAAVYDGARMRIYVDGSERASAPFTGTIQYGLGGDFFAGRLYATDPDHRLTGGVDEVRIHPQALPADRLKLDYATQKPGSDLIH